MKNFDELAQQVWNATDVINKRIYLNEMIDQFQHKQKQEKFRYLVSKARFTELDMLAKDILLRDTDKAI
jgi:hypothetical protein